MNVTATYSNGVFRPDKPVILEEGTHVEVVLPPGTRPMTEAEILAEFESRFPGVAGSLSDAAARELEQIIEEEFEKNATVQ